MPQTPTLTVWRHLYVERDSMSEPILTGGAAPSVFESGQIASVSGVDNIFLEMAAPVSLAMGQFQNGTIELLNASGNSLGTFDVQTNSGTVVTLDEPGPADAVAFRNLSDDDARHGIGAAAMEPDVSALASRLLPAYITVDTTRTDLSPLNANDVNQVGSLPFRMNVDTENNDEENLIYSVARQSVSEDGFWTVYIVGAFQPGLAVDRDSNHEQGEEGSPPLLGITSANRLGSIAFRETISDSKNEDSPGYVVSESELWQTTIIHELGHQLGIQGGNEHDIEMGAIMNYASMHNLPFAQLEFGREGFAIIILQPHPGP